MSASILVTGGLGFIGSRFIELVAQSAARIENIDLNTYAGDERRLKAAVRTHIRDVADPGMVDLIRDLSPDVIVHFAAESHVTRSERSGHVFERTNVEGTRRVFEAALVCAPSAVVHVSTDEVYGPCSGEPFAEGDKLPGEGAATSPYARSKAVADDLARSYADRVPVIVVRPTNCFGPYQHPEKAVARWAIKAARGERLPVWGDGGQVRDWMYVDDCCEAIRLLIEKGQPGQVYNVAPQGAQISNLELARAIARAAGRPESDVYLTAYDRPQHDRRYAVDASKLRALGWRPTEELSDRLAQTVDWYRHNPDWWESLADDAEGLYEDRQERV